MSAREIQTAVRRLVGGDQGYKSLDPVPAVGAQPGVVSVGHPGGAAGNASSAFEESDYTLRQYWTPAIEYISSDGLFVVEVAPIRSIALTGGATATFMPPPEV